MKRRLLVGTAFLGIVASGSGVWGMPFEFTYTGSLVDFTVPATGTYQILAFGAHGGDGLGCGAFIGNLVGPGGLGAEIGGDFSLTTGEVLQIAVGGAGTSQGSLGFGGGGRGGGSFVVGPLNTPLIIAGGGGGAFSGTQSGLRGQGGRTGSAGGTPESFGASPGAGGIGGQGGAAGSEMAPGGGGGGFLGPGGTGSDLGGQGGGTFPGLLGGLGAAGGGPGGFSGGGGGSQRGSGGGGGGGGDDSTGPGGGRGSFDAGADQILVADFQIGSGEVVIAEVATPEPASLALLGSALIGLAVLWWRRRSEK